MGLAAGLAGVAIRLGARLQTQQLRQAEAEEGWRENVPAQESEEAEWNNAHYRRVLAFALEQVRDDTQITDAEIAASNLILWGDPGSNKLLARIADKLPVRWTADSIIAGKNRWPASTHAPILIYPNPLNPKRYVVINSGHTFGETELRGTNALLFPRLGDYAVLGTDGAVALAGLFHENWRF